MEEIITASEYNKLNNKEQLHFVPYEWSEYEDVEEESTCYECGHVTKEIVKAPTSTAKVLTYRHSIAAIWAPRAQELVSNTIILANLIDKNDK